MDIKYEDLLHNSSIERMMYTPDDKKVKVLQRIEATYLPALEKIDRKRKELDMLAAMKGIETKEEAYLMAV